MSRTYSKISSQHQKHPKANFRQYLYNANQSHQEAFSSIPPELEIELLENSQPLRQNFRNRTYRIRSY